MTIKSMLAASAALLVTTAAAPAAEVAALWGDNTISIVDTSQKKVVKTWSITGVNGKVLGIDVRPVDGMLYAVGADGGIYTVDLKTGRATMKSKLDQMLAAGTWATVDFNPVADRLRLMSHDGTNLRVNVDDGKATVDGALKFKDGDANAGKTPNVIAGAYSNSYKGTKATALYDIDASGFLLTQAPPNDGILNTIGSLGVKLNGATAFNIVAQGEDNAAWLVTGGSLYSVDLKSGKATAAGKLDGVKGKLTDIAWVD